MKIFHFCANHVNIGDRISADGIFSLLHERHSNIEYYRLFCDKEFVASCTQIVEQKYTNDDLIIVGGGGLLIQYFMPFWKWLARFRTGKCRYILWGLGVCENDRLKKLTDTDMEIFQTIFKYSIVTSVRDKLTHNLFNELGSIAKAGCPAHVMITKLEINNESIDSHLLYVDHSDLTTKEELDHISSVLNLYGMNIGIQKTLFCNNLCHPKQPVSQYLKTYYENAKIIVTTRLHGAIIGLSLGKPVVAISKDTKLNSYFSDFGLDSYITDNIDNLTEILEKTKTFPDISKVLNKIIARNAHMSDEIKTLTQGTFT